VIRRIPLALALICVAGALLRFATLDVQSLWYDEAVTAHLLRLDFAGLWQAIPDSESTPPLYYVLAWLWTQLAGTGEVGMRSLSALLGSATIPIVWAIGRRLGGDRAGVIAAALLAVNPMLVWFSQEARAYALLALLGALSALLWLRMLERPGAGRGLAWALVAALALATHYYAIFEIAPQALWLLLRVSNVRARAAALVPLAAAGAALAPLALGQRSNDSAAFIADSSLATRLAQVPKQLLVGYDAPAETLLAVLSAVVLAVAACGLWRLLTRRVPAEAGGAVRAPADGDSAPPRAPAQGDAAAQPPAEGGAAPPWDTGPSRREARLLTGVVAAALALPAIAALGGEDHLISRNLLAAAPLACALAGAGLAAVAATRPGLGRPAIAAGCVLGLVAVLGVDADPASRRDDWRGAVQALGRAPGARVVIASPASGAVALEYYLPHARPLTARGVATGEIDYVAIGERRPGERPRPPRPQPAPAPVPGFALVGRTEATTFTVLRLRAGAPQPVVPAALGAGLDGGPPAVLEATR
jgi:mannosyltransferase